MGEVVLPERVQDRELRLVALALTRRVPDGRKKGGPVRHCRGRKEVSVSVFPGIDQGAPAFWPERVLEACEGFRVKKSGRFLGFVESVRWEQGHPLELIVEVGRAQPRHVLVPVAAVARIVAGSDLIELRDESPA